MNNSASLKVVKGAKERKSEVFAFRTTNAEAIKIIQQAQHSEMNIADYIRACVLNNKTDFGELVRKSNDISKDLKKLLFELHQQGNNINQIAHSLNKNAAKMSKDELNSAIKDLNKISVDITEIRNKFFNN